MCRRKKNKKNANRFKINPQLKTSLLISFSLSLSRPLFCSGLTFCSCLQNPLTSNPNVPTHTRHAHSHLLLVLLLLLLRRCCCPPSCFQSATGAVTPAKALCGQTACCAWRDTCCKMECAPRVAPLAPIRMETNASVSPLKSRKADPHPTKESRWISK